jgi:MYXO-CTERM domain-containing protein
MGVSCGDREVCIEGICQPACQCRPCEMGYQCQPDGYCVPDACVGMTCPTGQYCMAGMCRDACEHGPDSRMCPPSEQCVLGVCEPIGTGPRDGGVRDTGVGRDTGPVRDGSSADGGPIFINPSRVGCACHAGRPAGRATGAGLLLALAAVAVARRRRR